MEQVWQKPYPMGIREMPYFMEDEYDGEQEKYAVGNSKRKGQRTTTGTGKGPSTGTGQRAGPGSKGRPRPYAIDTSTEWTTKGQGMQMPRARKMRYIV